MLTLALPLSAMLPACAVCGAGTVVKDGTCVAAPGEDPAGAS
jgi:hypothetical protein